MNRSNILPFLLAAPILAACAAAPTQEMADAKATLKVAEGEGGKEHADTILGSARKMITEAQTQLELGNYSKARNLALRAREEGNRARRLAAALNEANAAVESAARAQGLWASAETALKKAQAAAREGNDREALAESAMAIEFARLGENHAYLELARNMLESCGNKLPEAEKQRLAALAANAIASDEGKIALRYAEMACN